MGFFQELKWLLKYRKDHPKASKVELDAALKHRRMQEVGKNGINSSIK